ncbi:MAG TPA: NADH-quinone oxidoreductase subunit C [Bryobacteraceae bacterium]|nr:NADH-quinone oxidoreductase subunit C [Bryobacteraceae bacterium]HOL71824.1 NADH-quinone oxidoreductase subunit C [Bryobacteraceae bacterium]HPQ15050.1 NADH-quinone oxidoreductase subunit C [Bryobacteraceae bacterium]
MNPEQFVEILNDWNAGAVLAWKFDRGELTVEVAPEQIVPLCQFLKSEQGFIRLSAVTAVDRYPMEPRFEVLYLLHSIEPSRRLRVKCRLGGEQPEIDSVTCVWRSANWYEREVFDLFGVRFRNHPDLRRILLPEGWKGHPLRKDYPVTGEKYTYSE